MRGAGVLQQFDGELGGGAPPSYWPLEALQADIGAVFSPAEPHRCQSREITPQEQWVGEERFVEKLSSLGCASTVRLSTVAILLCLQAVIFLAAGGTYLAAYQGGSQQASAGLVAKLQSLKGKVTELSQDNVRLHTNLRSLQLVRPGGVGVEEALEERGAEKRSSSTSGCDRPYQAITGVEGHKLPEFYGSVKEKTIWSFWYHPEDCPSSSKCTLPPHIKLCTETVEHNRGGFDYRIVHMDEVDKYVNGIELPVRWKELKPAQQKDSLMNALLARYGGVAFDISMILFRPLDEYWDEMVKQGASFRGYLYRLNGSPWRHAEATAVWFLMSRREGIFSAAVRSQVIGMGDSLNNAGYLDWYLALGDQTILPVLSMYDYNLPKCYDDETVSDKWKCPEHAQPAWYKGVSGPARTDTKLLLEDPRQGPQLPFAWLGMETWSIKDSTMRAGHGDWADNPLGAPMHDTDCSSMKECWDKVFMPRYEAHQLNFIKFFRHGAKLAHRTRGELLADKGSYFYNWLRLAGLLV